MYTCTAQDNVLVFSPDGSGSAEASAPCELVSTQLKA